MIVVFIRALAVRQVAILCALLALLVGTTVQAGTSSIILQSTTSTQNSGLYDYLLPVFTNASGIKVRVVAVGTGQAIANARRCDGDVLIVHSTADELDFVARGYGTQRHDLMYNDFVILGPSHDPAKIRGMQKAPLALEMVAQSALAFASRGDNSGTHKAERRLWSAAGITPVSGRQKWYRETGSGMGSTLNFAVQTDAYVLSDRATWLAFGNKADHEILVEGDPALFNQYGIIPVSSDTCPKTKVEAVAIFADWLLSVQGQAVIAAYQRGGQQLFFPNAR